MNNITMMCCLFIATINAMIIYLARHAETQENLDGIVQGWTDTELTKKGNEQSEQLANTFVVDIDAIISSDLKRCTQTAQPFIDKHPHLQYTADPRLRERNLGDAQGQYWSKEQWMMYWKNGAIDQPITGSETIESFTQRLEGFMDAIRNEYPTDAKLLIITHGGVINRILEITKTNNDEASFVNTAITKINI